MPITQEQFLKLTEWMNQKNIRMTCPACRNTGFSPGEIVAHPHYSSGVVELGHVEVMLQMVCTQCGNTFHFPAKILG